VINVIDYQTGNSRSVAYALEYLGVPCSLTAKPSDVAEIDRFILPGVGSAEVTMKSLSQAGWSDFLAEHVIGDGVPFLGVCVGLQVLFEHSEEGDTGCLGWFPGSVARFAPAAVRVPQMGWNRVTAASDHPFVESFPADGYFYFVNSYYANPARRTDVAGWTEYGVEFASVVARNNVMATQFHIEKSGPCGLSLLRRFASLDRESLRAD